MQPPPRLSITTTAADGMTLSGELIATPSPVAVVVASHAMMVDRRTLDRPRGEGLTSTLADAGLAVLTFDIRHHGDSGVGADRGGAHAYDEIVRWDLPAMVAAARARYPTLGVAVVGHSLAAHAAMMAAGRDPATAPDAIVALAANLWMPQHEPSRARRFAKGAMFRAWLLATRWQGYFDSRALGLGTDAEPLAYVQQMVRFFADDALRSQDGREDYQEALTRVAVPVLALSSHGDRLFAHPEAVIRFLSMLPRERVEHRILGSADLDPAPDHMGLVLDPRMRPQWQRIARWIAARLA